MDGTNFLGVFVEGTARLTSYALTDKEKETIVQGFHRFHERLERINSSSSLRQLAIESQNRHSSRCNHKDTSCTQNAIRGLLKAFIVGFGVKFGLEAIPHIISLRLLSRPSLLLRAFSRDTASFASFLAVLIGSYKATLCGMRHMRGGHGSDYTNALVAGLVSGLVSGKLDRSSSRRNAIALYLFSRALQYGSVWLFERWAAWQQTEEDKIRSRGMKRAYSIDVVGAMGGRRRGGTSGERGISEAANPQPKLNWDTVDWSPTSKISWSPEVVDTQPKPEARRAKAVRAVIRFVRDYAATGLMTASVLAINYVVAFHTDSVPRSYANLLFRSSGFDSLYPGQSPNAFRVAAHNLAENGGTSYGIPSGMPSKQFVQDFPHGSKLARAFSDTIHHDSVACAVFHPHTVHCTVGGAAAFFRGLPFAMKMYVPFNTAVQLLFKRTQALRDPLGLIVKILQSSARSSAFFVLMTTCVTQAPCLLRALLGRDTRAGYILGGILGGLAVLIEMPSRRVELGMYCFLRGLQMLWDVGLKQGRWRNVRHGELVLLSL
ncbi:hypothetical protein H4S01_005663, partial [Coemansia sp. RSA 2610]